MSLMRRFEPVVRSIALTNCFLPPAFWQTIMWSKTTVWPSLPMPAACVMSTDRAEDVGIHMAELSPSSIAALDEVLPAHWSHGNPVDILGDATSERYQKALEICLNDENIDGVLVILTPQAMTNPTQVAQCIIDGTKGSKKPVLASWTGGARVHEGRNLFAASEIAHFSTPEVAVDIFISGQL
jgi:acetyltransferase